MGFDANLYAVPVLIVGVATGALAWLVYRSRPDSAENRRLALLEAVVAAVLLAVGLLWSSTEPSDARAWSGVIMVFWFASMPLLLRFLAVLDSPLSRPLRGRTADRALLVLAFAAPVVWFASSELFIGGIVPFEPYVPLRPVWEPAWDDWNRLYSVVYTFSAVVAISAWHRAPAGSIRRRQIGVYALAAVASDLVNIARVLVVAPHMSSQVRAGLAPPSWEVQFYMLSIPVAFGLFVVLMAYGILKAQVFDIDLKIKWTVKQSTVAAAFIAAFFVVSELASGLLSDRIGNVAGVMAAGVLVFAIAPLQRFAERVSSAAVPGASTTPEYAAQRKLDVYRGALESLMQDGRITTKERGTLLRLQDDLGLDAAQANRVEADVLRVMGAAA